MALGPCKLADCTYNVTGQCVLGRPVDECSNRAGFEEQDEEDETEAKDGDGLEDNADKVERADVPGRTEGSGAVLEQPEELPRLPPSLTMGLEDAGRMMSARHVSMVGVVGLSDSGKTACLASAYLLLARAQFEGYSYADSATLMAFEQICRGSRQWAKGEEPTQMTLHTEMADDRQAGFMHLRLRRDEDGQLFDLLLPDLPGEWSRALIDKADTERFGFLAAASVVWIMVDGRAFSKAETRQYATYRTEMLVERLAGVLPRPRPRVILVSSWRDIGEFPHQSYERIREEGRKHGMDVSLAQIASFSSSDVRPGLGVAQLIDVTLNHDRAAPEFWPDDCLQATRTLNGFRRAA